MSYRYSNIDRANADWFQNDTSRASLHAIDISRGEIRGLSRIEVEFEYPITAIAGRNGSGKTTILALAACAFHNHRDGYRLPGRKLPYYRFSDFFIQTSEEVPLEGIGIRYKFLHNKWRVTRKRSEPEGHGWQVRKKSYGGRWNNYDRRVKRTVLYLGNDRIVPHAEKSVSRSYKRLFQPIEAQGWEEGVMTIVSRILDQDYSEFEYRRHSVYRLPFVTVGDTRYSGFNMGAGEDALFSMIATLLGCPEGSLILIDEIELGLHEEAQEKLIREMKQICRNEGIQIICTTHSPRILESLPPEARILLERVGQTARVIPGISSAFATGKMAGRHSDELDILVEDEIAKSLVEACLDATQRLRASILPIGSASAIMRHLAHRFIENRPSEVLAVLDGDMQGDIAEHTDTFVNALERQEMQENAREWLDGRVHYLPGETWPENWILTNRCAALYERFERDLGMDVDGVNHLLAAAARAGKHNEIFEAAKLVNVEEAMLLSVLARAAIECAPDERYRIRELVSERLE